jgi:FkbM family methyltransferase
MVVNTRRLFIQLLRTLRIDMVCDVGSMNGADALAFRAAVPDATVLAFEANSDNYHRMRTDHRLHASGITTLPLAVTDHDGHAAFHMTGSNYAPGDAWRGMSSLHKRFSRPELLTSVTVATTRLDSALRHHDIASRRLALWIDAEGKGYEVLVGAKGIVDQVQLVHIEVETTPCIGRDQRLYAQVRQLLLAAGFVEFATDQRPTNIQFNALFVRRHLSIGTILRMRGRLLVGKARWSAVRIVRATCPALLHCYLAHRR